MRHPNIWASKPLLLFFLLLLSQSLIALPKTVSEDLEQQLRDRVLEHYPSAIVSVTVKDQQKLYKPCADPTVEISGQALTGRIPVRVRCHDTTPWSYFIQASVHATEEIVIARHPIKRGALITAQDLALNATDIDTRRRYFASPTPVIGALAARSIAAQQPIQARHLNAALAVKRGDQVVIQARHGAAVISATGTALKSGHVGEQIPVANSSSERIVHTWIIAKGRVATRATRS